MADSAVRIQICGRVAVEIDGEPRESRLPGRQGRLLFCYLVLYRHEPITRARLTDALWPAGPPPAAESGLNALLSKVRAVLGADAISPRGPVQLRLPADAWIDYEAALDAAHRAESALSLGDCARAWACAQTALFTARRGFLLHESVEWADEARRRLADVYRRSLETYAGAALAIGGTELATAERACRELIGLVPFRESAYGLLMQTLAARGNVAEALLVYESLRQLLRDELGVAPGPDVRALHEQILTG
ncbi:MAG TPA: BTAD domain-containing putative transcriptional regulator [Mycobacteriales bacterium]|nr:BTAD domain-containing putative transcriptional regulator [Mycobacteriales bacterium]